MHLSQSLNNYHVDTFLVNICFDEAILFILFIFFLFADSDWMNSEKLLTCLKEMLVSSYPIEKVFFKKTTLKILMMHHKVQGDL